MTQHLCWLDLETTGSDEVAGDILEIGMVVTTSRPPFEERASTAALVSPTDPNWRVKMEPVVAAMHDRNGLADAVDADGQPLRTVEQWCCNFLNNYDPPLRLAGSGVGHFDRRWLRRHMPELEAMFDYPVMDVGVIRRLFQYSGRSDLVPSLPAEGKPHRGLDDALLHLSEFRHYVGVLAALPVAIT